MEPAPLEGLDMPAGHCGCRMIDHGADDFDEHPEVCFAAGKVLHNYGKVAVFATRVLLPFSGFTKVVGPHAGTIPPGL